MTGNCWPFVDFDTTIDQITDMRNKLGDPPMSDELRGVYRVRYDFVCAVAPASVFEIGVRVGYHASVMMCAAPFASYYGIDNDSGTYGGVRGYCRFALCLLGRYNFQIELMDSQQLTKLLQSYDLIHIDGDHSYEGCLRDLKLCLPYVKKAIILDDYYYIAEVKKACDAFANQFPSLKTFVLEGDEYRGGFVVDFRNQGC